MEGWNDGSFGGVRYFELENEAEPVGKRKANRGPIAAGSASKALFLRPSSVVSHLSTFLVVLRVAFTYADHF
jgi:hypothetical protein